MLSAVEVQKSDFIITTEPYQNLSIEVINPSTNEVLQEFGGRARKFESNNFQFTYYGTIPSVSLNARIMNNETGEVLHEKKFGPYNLGTPSYNIEFFYDNAPTEVSTETETTETETSETNQTSPSSISGLVIGENGKFRSVYYYIVGAVLGVVILLVVLRKRMSMTRSSPTEPHPSKVIKKTTKPAKTEVAPTVVDKTDITPVNDTEKRIADLQKQLEQVRNEEKLAKLEKQLALEKQSLNRMKEPAQPQNNNSSDQPKPF
jgi:hypothetical protein